VVACGVSTVFQQVVLDRILEGDFSVVHWHPLVSRQPAEIMIIIVMVKRCSPAFRHWS
jgi:hypothetical protein